MDGDDDDIDQFLEQQKLLEEESKTPGEFREGNIFSDDTDAVNPDAKKKVRKPPTRKGNTQLTDIIDK